MMKKQYIFLILLLVFAGCKSTKKTVEKTYDNPMLVEKMWAVTAINGSELQYPNQGDVAYIVFGKKMNVTGFGGCNNFSGKYQVSGDSILIKDVGATRKTCLEQRIEDAFFKALDGVVSFKASKNNLKLYDQRKRVIINAIIIEE